MEAILYFIFLQASLFVIGYPIITRLGVFKTYRSIQICLGYGLSLVVMGILATLYYAYGLPALAAQIIFWIIFLLGIFLIIKDCLYLHLFKNWLPITAMIAVSIFSICITTLSLSPTQPVVPDPMPQEGRNYSTLNTKIINLAKTRANDNYIPYRQAQFFVNKSDPANDSFISEWGVHFFQRTPLMGSVAAGFFIALGDRPPIDYTWSTSANDADNTYVKFQILAQILNSLFIIPAFFLLRKLFTHKVAVVSLFFLVPSQFFVYNSFFSWPKSLVAFFILMSWLLLITSKKTRYTVAAAIASGLAYLTHDLAILYIGASALFLLYSRRFKDLFIIGLGSAVFALPWLVVSSIIYHKPSSFIYYPISIKDIPQPAQYKEVIETFFNTSPLQLIWIRIESLFYLLSPYQLIINENGQSPATRLWALGLYSLPGAIGIGLILPVIMGIYKYRKNIMLWILWFMPLVFCVLIIGWPRGLGALHFAEAVVVLLTGIAVSWITTSRFKKWTYVAFALSAAQLFFFILFTYDFSIVITSLKDVLALTIIVAIPLICGAGIYQATNKRARLYKLLNLH